MFLFPEDDLGGLKKRTRLALPPPIPETGWRPPVGYPNLSAAKVIALDTETFEPDFDHGPGWGRGKGHIVGVSLAAIDAHGNRGKWYFPVRHEVEPQDNLDPATTFRWLKTVLETPNIPKVGANLLYDVGWLTTENIFVQGDLHDVQFAEALLNEEGEVALEFLGQKYCGTGKESDVLYRWCAEAYGGAANGKQRGNIYRAPPCLVGHYAEEDADLPLRVLDRQWPLLAAEGLKQVYRMECDSIYLLTRMRLTGVNVDLRVAEQLYGELAVDIRDLNAQLYTQVGIHANVNSGADLGKVFDKIGLRYPQTAAGNPSFTKEFLKTVEHPVADLIREIRAYDKIRSTFLRSYILESNVNGRVHCQFHPLRGDDGGTRSGRFSSDKPNLQNIPVRSKLGKRIRKLFIPDTGHLCWEKNDYSQIEYRFLAHFAVGVGADGVRDRYNKDPKTDYHDMTIELVRAITGQTIDRKPIKNINFGLLYGMGESKLAKQIGIEKKTAKELFKAYHEGNPYVKATMDAAADEAQRSGYVTTVLGRRSRFNLWEPKEINYDSRAVALPHERALRYYGVNIQRAHTHKAINRKLQGSAADMIKVGMWRCLQDGVFDVIGVPKLQVHDELDFSVVDDSMQQEEAFAHMRHVLATALPLRIPALVDSGRGPNWGAVE
jgi:DNA polymerase-1